MLLYAKEVVILLNMFSNFKSKHILKGAIVQTERKQGKLTCESNPLEGPNIKRLKQTKRLKCVFSTTSNLRFATM